MKGPLSERRPQRGSRHGGWSRSLILAVLIHALLIVLVVVGWRWQSASSRGVAVQPAVQTRLISEAPVREAEPAPKQPVKQEPEKRPDGEARRQKEEEQARAERERVQAEKRRLEETRALEQKKKLEEQKRLADLEKQRLEEDRQRKAKEAEAVKKKGDEQRRREAEDELKKRLAAEEGERRPRPNEPQPTAVSPGEIDRYKALIEQKVRRNWIKPAGWPEGLECTVQVQLAAGGTVMNVTRASCGNAAFDRSVENAVYKASPLPVPEDPALFGRFRAIDFKFKN